MNENIGCLLIHGLGGAVSEIEPLADYLEKEGCLVETPILKGHTGQRKDLQGVSYEDWIHSAEKSLLKLKSKCQKIIVVGFSMGGLIALNLAKKNLLLAVITINTPIYYWNFKIIFQKIADDFKSKNYSNINHYLRSNQKLPLNALVNFQILLEKTKRILKTITCSVLIIQALEDDSVKWQSGHYLFENLAAVDKKIKYYEKEGHLILKSAAAGNVIKEIKTFIDIQTAS